MSRHINSYRVPSTEYLVTVNVFLAALARNPRVGWAVALLSVITAHLQSPSCHYGIEQTFL